MKFYGASWMFFIFSGVVILILNASMGKTLHSATADRFSLPDEAPAWLSGLQGLFVMPLPHLSQTQAQADPCASRSPRCSQLHGWWSAIMLWRQTTYVRVILTTMEDWLQYKSYQMAVPTLRNMQEIECAFLQLICSFIIFKYKNYFMKHKKLNILKIWENEWYL